VAYVYCEEVFGIFGENFTLAVKIDKKPEEIIWTKNKDKVAEWEGQNDPMYFTSLQNRGLLNTENGGLTVFNLEYDDTGTYVFEYLDSAKRSNNLTFILTVLPPPSEPKISCNVSDDNYVLKCTALFQKPLDYAWKLSSPPTISHGQKIFIPKKNASGRVMCFIKFSQTEKSSEISLTSCSS
ncbi:LFA3 protein, partial [Brachypteracias leptosomus]|nr:LFA3 protein [Brachypteracias leptosomus]